MIDFSMRVLTMNGDKPLIELRAGDTVLSLSGTKLVNNQVRRRTESSAASLMKIVCKGKSVICNPDQTLATKGRVTTYKRVWTIAPGHWILRVEDGIGCIEEITSMETNHGAPTPVIGLVLQRFPFNFVVNGFVCGGDS